MEIVFESPHELQGLFDELSDAFYGLDLTEYCEAEIKIAEQDVEERLRNEVDFMGNPLAPLAASTIAKKGHDLILRDTGAMGRSLIHSGDDEAIVEVFSEPGQSGWSRGSRDEKLPFHQSGTRRMPQRAVVGFEPEYIEGAANRLADYIVDELGRMR